MTFTVSKTVSDETLNCIITIESGGRLTAKAPTSSALGLGQFLNATWMGVVRKHRPDLLEGRTESEVLALRTSPQLAVELLARFTEDNQHAIGMNCTGGDLYLAHFLGVGDARKLFTAEPATPVSLLVSTAVISANRSIMLGKTAAQVRAWAAKRMHESMGHDWVARYYKAPKPVEEPAPPAAETDAQQDAEQDAEDIPDPQDAPAAPEPRRDPVPPVTPVMPVTPPPVPGVTTPKDPTQITPAPKETFYDWINRKRKTVWSAVTGVMGGGSALTYFTDWKILAVVVAGLIIGGSIVYAFWLLSRPKT